MVLSPRRGAGDACDRDDLLAAIIRPRHPHQLFIRTRMPRRVALAAFQLGSVRSVRSVCRGRTDTGTAERVALGTV
jgi:hypothetical protein